MTLGRPTDYTDELADRICGYIASNPVSIKKICAKYDDIPTQDTIFCWLAKHEYFSGQYLIAKEKQALLVADDLWQESDELLPITEEINRFNARFRFQQWHLSKLAPKQFNDKKEKEDPNNGETLKNLSSAVKELAAKHEKDY